MSKNFKEWYTVKENLHNKTDKNIIPKEREVYWASVGVNIGHEQDGKGDVFSRPVLVIKRYNKNLFFWSTFIYANKRRKFLF